MLDRIWTVFAPLLIVFLGLDQITKEWAERNLSLADSVKFGFNLSHNEGVVFGLYLPVWVIYLMTTGILVLGTYLEIKERLWQDRWHLTGLALLLAGAVGNLIDRVRFGYVIDFIQVYWWPTFNLADVWIVAECVCSRGSFWCGRRRFRDYDTINGIFWYNSLHAQT